MCCKHNLSSRNSDSNSSNFKPSFSWPAVCLVVYLLRVIYWMDFSCACCDLFQHPENIMSQSCNVVDEASPLQYDISHGSHLQLMEHHLTLRVVCIFATAQSGRREGFFFNRGKRDKATRYEFTLTKPSLT